MAWLWVVVAVIGCGEKRIDTNLDAGSSGTGGTGTGGSAGAHTGGQSGAGSGGSAGAAGTGTGGAAGASGDRCQLPAETGICSAALQRWWFNAATGKCEPFVYGGCGGNDNNFETAQECVGACAANVSNACDAIDCGQGKTCVFAGQVQVCAPACGSDGSCPNGQSCGCAASCPGCKDCVKVCLLG